MKKIILDLRIAHSIKDRVHCKYLIASIYNAKYGIFFSKEMANPNARVEPWPHEFLMAFIDGQLAACAGIYIRSTYVDRFGNVAPQEFQSVLDAALCSDQYTIENKCELTKLVVHPAYQRLGIDVFFGGAIHSKDFVNLKRAGDLDNFSGDRIIVNCARRKMYDYFYGPLGIHTRKVKDFPRYAAHQKYSSADDPMETHMIIPHLDIPPKWLNLAIPGNYDIHAPEFSS